MQPEKARDASIALDVAAVVDFALDFDAVVAAVVVGFDVVALVATFAVVVAFALEMKLYFELFIVALCPLPNFS